MNTPRMQKIAGSLIAGGVVLLLLARTANFLMSQGLTFQGRLLLLDFFFGSWLLNIVELNHFSPLRLIWIPQSAVILIFVLWMAIKTVRGKLQPALSSVLTIIGGWMLLGLIVGKVLYCFSSSLITVTDLASYLTIIGIGLFAYNTYSHKFANFNLVPQTNGGGKVMAESLNISEAKPQGKIKIKRENRLEKVSLAGGIIGMLGTSPRLALQSKLSEVNAQGWYVRQIIPDSTGNLFVSLLRFLILIVTLLLYTPRNGYFIVLEREVE